MRSTADRCPGIPGVEALTGRDWRTGDDTPLSVFRLDACLRQVGRDKREYGEFRNGLAQVVDAISDRSSLGRRRGRGYVIVMVPDKWKKMLWLRSNPVLSACQNGSHGYLMPMHKIILGTGEFPIQK